MTTNYLEVIEQGKWLVENLPLFKEKYPRRAYEYITPVFNEHFGVNFTKRQVYARNNHYQERLNHPEKAYKYSSLSNAYTREELDTFYNWMNSNSYLAHKEWEEKWLEITGKKLSYASITQRLFQYGYRWGKSGTCHTRSAGKSFRHKVGDIIKRRNSKGKDGNHSYVNWIKVKSFEDLSKEEKNIHIKHKRNLESDPCWMRHDKYVLLCSGKEISEKDYVVHLNGNTLDDSLDNLYVTDNYWEYNNLKIKGLCEIPSLVEASLELRKIERIVKKHENENN